MPTGNLQKLRPESDARSRLVFSGCRRWQLRLAKCTLRVAVVATSNYYCYDAGPSNTASFYPLGGLWAGAGGPSGRPGGGGTPKVQNLRRAPTLPLPEPE